MSAGPQIWGGIWGASPQIEGCGPPWPNFVILAMIFQGSALGLFARKNVFFVSVNSFVLFFGGRDCCHVKAQVVFF